MQTHRPHSTSSLQEPTSSGIRDADRSAASLLDSARDLPCSDQGVKSLLPGVTYRDFGDPDRLRRHLRYVPLHSALTNGPNGTESVLPTSNELRNTQTAEPNTQDASSNGRYSSLKTGGSQVLRLVKKGWAKLKKDEKAPERRVYLGLQWPDVKHPFDRAKEHRALASRGYPSTIVDPQTTRQSSPESSKPNVPKQPRTDLSFSGTAAASLPPSDHLPDDPKDVSRPPSSSDSQSSEGYDGSGWNVPAYYANPRGEAEFDQAESND